MNIKDHINLLLKEYNLINLYYKFLLLSVITTLITRGFYWILIIFYEIIKKNNKLIKKFSIILVIIFLINIPLKNMLKNITVKLMKEIKIANIKYFNIKIKNINKNDLLHINLLNYHNNLMSFNEDLERYILNSKNEYEIPFYYITILIITINKKNGLIFGLFIIFYIIIRTLNEVKILKEIKLINDTSIYNENIKNYISCSKNFLINDELNETHLFNNIDKFEESKLKLHKLNNTLDNHSNVTMLFFVLILISNKINDLNEYDFMYYFLIVYDIEFLSNKITNYYKDNTINVLQEKLDFLNNINYDITYKEIIEPINKIIINKLNNNNPNINIYKPIIIEGHILINGNSGGGKTLLLYILKGVLIPNIINIQPSINEINNQSYISISNNKHLFNGLLYNIITNYDSDPNIDLIKIALKISKLDHIFTNNIYINIHKISNGERTRLYISQIIYIVKSRGYNILLFDEIDENLDENTSLEICNNIKDYFKEKIILYVSNNKLIKKLFKNNIIIKDGLIEQTNI